MSVAKRYTRAFYETLKAADGSEAALEKYRLELLEFERLVSGVREAKVALYSPVFSSIDKIKLIKLLVQRAGISSVTSNFLVLLARKNRLSLLPKVVESFDEVVAEAEGVIFGEVVSADALSPADLSNLVQSFEKKLGRKVRFKVKTDGGLLAGVKVTVNGVTYDGSLKAQFNRLKESFLLGV